MADGNKPSGVRNFFGGLVDRIALGNNYNRQTGQFSNVGRGLAGRGLGVLATAVGGPLAGRVVNTGVGNYIDTGSVTRYGYGTGPAARLFGRDANSVGDVVPEQIGPGRPSGGNLGFGGGGPQGVAPGQLYRDPYLGWQQYLAPQGSINNFGNNNIQTAPVPDGWQPQSDWGRDVLRGGTGAGPSGGGRLNLGGSGGGRDWGGTHMSSGRGGATTRDPSTAGELLSWLGSAGEKPGFHAFARAIK
jgi:hypothetical protein